MVVGIAILLGSLWKPVVGDQDSSRLSTEWSATTTALRLAALIASDDRLTPHLNYLGRTGQKNAAVESCDSSGRASGK